MFQHVLLILPALIPFAIATMAVIAVVTLRGYRSVLSVGGGRWRWLLPALRAGALLAVAGSLLKPVLVRARQSAERGAIVLLIDQSRSMGVADTVRTPSQLVELAGGLRLLPDNAHLQDVSNLNHAQESLRTLAADLASARGQLDYARATDQSTGPAELRLKELSGHAAELAESLLEFPEVAHLLEDLSLSAIHTDTPTDQWTDNIADLAKGITAEMAQAEKSTEEELYKSDEQTRRCCDQLASLSRLKIVSKAITSQKMNLLPRLMKQAAVFAFGFSEAVSPLAVQGAHGESFAVDLSAIGTRSDLTGALRAVRAKLQATPVQAVVLLSDGRQVGSSGDLPRVISSLNAPIFTISCAGPSLKDLAITRLQSQADIFVGQMLSLRVEIRQTGFQGAAVELTVDANGKHQVRTLAVRNDRDIAADLSIPFEHAGRQTIKVSVTPQPGEATFDNNSYTTSVRVLADKVKVLSIAGAADAECRSIQKALAASPFIELHEEILAAENAKLSATPQQMRQYAVFLLNDVKAGVFSRDQLDAIASSVRKGAGLLLIPGEARNLLELSHHSGVASLLPFIDVQEAAWRVWPGEAGYFQLMPAPGLQQQDELALTDDIHQNADRWAELAAMFRFMPVAEPRPEVIPLLVERDSGLPVLTQMQVDAGKAFFFGTRETWRWRDQSGRGDADRFWSQLVRHAAPEHAGAATLEVSEALAELANVAGDEGRLRRIATISGGEMIPIERIAELPEKIRASGERLPGVSEYPLWNSGYLFCFVVGCLSLEWALGKRLGLV